MITTTNIHGNATMIITTDNSASSDGGGKSTNSAELGVALGVTFTVLFIVVFGVMFYLQRKKRQAIELYGNMNDDALIDNDAAATEQ